MSKNEVGDSSPEYLAKANRQRLSAERAAQAMKDAADKAIAVRENMARLRQLRLAKEEAQVRTQIASANAKANSRKR